MKHTFFYSALLAFAVVHAAEPISWPDGPYINAPTITDIPGTSLKKLELLTRPSKAGSKDWITCKFVIGYHRKIEGKDHGTSYKFVRILELPGLAPYDHYTVTVADGVLRIATEQGKREVAALYLADCWPAFLTTESEQSSADQPATKPADKAPSKVQPPPPTSKDGPRNPAR